MAIFGKHTAFLMTVLDVVAIEQQFLETSAHCSLKHHRQAGVLDACAREGWEMGGGGYFYYTQGSMVVASFLGCRSI